MVIAYTWQNQSDNNLQQDVRQQIRKLRHSYRQVRKQSIVLLMVTLQFYNYGHVSIWLSE